MTIATGIAAIKTGFDIAKSIRELVKQEKFDPNEVSSQLLLLQQVMLDTQKALNDAQEDVQRLKEQLAAQDKIGAIEKDLDWVADGGFYIRKSERESGKYIAYCPLCWGDSRKLVPLNPNTGHGYYSCNIHKSNHQTAAFRRLEQSQSSIYSSGDSDPEGWMR